MRPVREVPHVSTADLLAELTHIADQATARADKAEAEIARMRAALRKDEESLAKVASAQAAHPRTAREDFDHMIGRLDRLLSEFLVQAECKMDEADWQTIKHHAEDLIGVGNAALKRLGRSE
jgi:hypothetical protein